MPVFPFQEATYPTAVDPTPTDCVINAFIGYVVSDVLPAPTGFNFNAPRFVAVEVFIGSTWLP